MEGILSYLATRAIDIREPGKKSFQKLVYFLQTRGVPLNYRYTMHFYGPYSEPLSNDIDEMTFEGILQYIPSGHSVLVKPGPSAQMVIEEEQSFISQYKQEIEFVIENFFKKSSSDLELLATTHFVANATNTFNIKELVAKVFEIKKEKLRQVLRNL